MNYLQNDYILAMTKDELNILFERHDMRMTRPRLAVANLLLADKKHRHVSAEWVARELKEKDENISLATVYNTLKSFVEVGLLRQIQVGGATTVFDTNTSAHHHFMKSSTGELIDIVDDSLDISPMPKPPEGANIKGWDLIIHID